MAQVLIEYVGEADSLKAVVAEAVKGNVAIAESATKAGQVASKAYKETAQSAKAAFGSQEVKKSLDSQVQGIDKLKAGIQLLYKEQIKIIQTQGKQSEAFKQNIKAAADLRAQIDTLTKEQNGYSVATGKASEKSISLTTQLKKMKAELSALDTAGKAGTKQFTDLSIAAAKLEDQIGDTRERIKTLSSDTFVFDAAVESVRGLTGAFTAVQGAVGLFAKDNEELQAAIAASTSAMAVLTGVQEVANIVTGQGAAKMGILTAAQSAFAFVTGTSTGALKAFRIALAGTGIGLIVIVLVAAYEAFQAFSKASDNAAASAENLNLRLAETQKILNDNAKAIISNEDKIKVATGQINEQEAQKRAEIRKTLGERNEAFKKQFADNERLKKDQAALIEQATKIGSTGFGVSKETRDQIAKNAELIIIGEKALVDIRTSFQKKLVSDLTVIELEGNTKKETAKEKTSKRVLAIEESTNLKSINNTRAYLDEQFRLAAEAADKELDLYVRSASDQLQAQLNVIDTQIIKNGESLEATKNRIRTEAELNREAEKQKVQDALVRSTAIEKITAKENSDIKKAEEKNSEDRKAANKKEIDLIIDYTQTFANALNQINELQAQLSQNRIDKINEEKNAQLDAINQTFDTERSKIRQREALELRTNRAIAAEKTKQAKADKALALFNAAINTAVSITKAAGNPVLIALAAITGAAQIAIIASKPIPKFAHGGVIGGKPHSEGGTQIEAEKDEFIVKRSQSVKHRKELDAINTSTQAFRAMIQESYVRPAIMNYVLNRRQERGVTVNASLNSKSMEAELKGLRKDIRNSRTRSINSPLDSRYSWQ
jgi:hypothetical protein